MITRQFLCLFVSLVVLSAIFPTVATIQPATAKPDAPWPMWRQNPAHTGAADGQGPANLAVKWKFKTEGPITSSPSIVDAKVYVGSYDRNLYCIDAQSGGFVWKYKVDAQILSSPTIVDGRVYIGPDDGNIYCPNANNGSLAWKTYGGGRIPLASSLWLRARMRNIVNTDFFRFISLFL